MVRVRVRVRVRPLHLARTLRAGAFDPEGLHKVEEQPMLERP